MLTTWQARMKRSACILLLECDELNFLLQTIYRTAIADEVGSLMPVPPSSIVLAIAKVSVDETEAEELATPGPVIPECSVCLQALESELLLTNKITTDCTHEEVSICVSCLRESIGAQADSKTWDEITCPNVDRTAVLQYPDLQRHAPAAVFERYDRHLTRQLLRADSDFQECAHPGCESGGLTDLERDTFLTCDACSRMTCLECNAVYHPGIICMQNRGPTDTGAGRSGASESRREEMRNEELASLKAVNERARACPGMVCRALIEKDGGCDHMRCKFSSLPVSLY